MLRNLDKKIPELTTQPSCQGTEKKRKKRNKNNNKSTSKKLTEKITTILFDRH